MVEVYFPRQIVSFTYEFWLVLFCISRRLFKLNNISLKASEISSVFLRISSYLSNSLLTLYLLNVSAIIEKKESETNTQRVCFSRVQRSLEELTVVRPRKHDAGSFNRSLCHLQPLSPPLRCRVFMVVIDVTSASFQQKERHLLLAGFLHHSVWERRPSLGLLMVICWPECSHTHAHTAPSWEQGSPLPDYRVCFTGSRREQGWNGYQVS